MKTWEQLDTLAKHDHLTLFRTRGGVTIYTAFGMQSSLMTLTVEDLTDEDGDIVMRRSTEAALIALKGIAP